MFLVNKSIGEWRNHAKVAVVFSFSVPGIIFGNWVLIDSIKSVELETVASFELEEATEVRWQSSSFQDWH